MPEATPPSRSLSRRVLRRVPFKPPFADVPGPFQSQTLSDTALDDTPTPDQNLGMRAFWWDGFWANIAETALILYLPLYIVAFGGSSRQVGLVIAFSSLFAALAFYPGARFVETFGHRKLTVLITGGGLSRIALLGLAVIPFVADGDTAIWLVLGCVSLRGFFGFFAIPAWTSLTADIVPIGMRGRFLASRNFGMSLSSLGTATIAGLLLDRFAGFDDWQIVWFVAATTGALSTWCYAQIPDPTPHADVIAKHDDAPPARSAVAEILSDRNFAVYLLGTLAWNIGLTAGGPFFNIYLAQNLHASGVWIGVLGALPALSGLVGYVYFGRIMDLRGTKWVMVSTGLLIPILPAAWIIVSEPWHIIPINVFGGIIWAGYSVAMLNMVMVLAPQDRRARYSAAFQTVTFVAAFAGPILGGQMIAVWGYRAVFAFSAAGRLLGTLIMWRFVKEGLRASP